MAHRLLRRARRRRRRSRYDLSREQHAAVHVAADLRLQVQRLVFVRRRAGQCVSGLDVEHGGPVCARPDRHCGGLLEDQQLERQWRHVRHRYDDLERRRAGRRVGRDQWLPVGARAAALRGRRGLHVQQPVRHHGDVFERAVHSRHRFGFPRPVYLEFGRRRAALEADGRMGLRDGLRIHARDEGQWHLEQRVVFAGQPVRVLLAVQAYRSVCVAGVSARERPDARHERPQHHQRDGDDRRRLQFDAFVIAQHGWCRRRHGAPVLTLFEVFQARQGAALAALFLFCFRLMRGDVRCARIRCGAVACCSLRLADSVACCVQMTR
ncbi:hypothetical protein PCAR4_410092 [Paraburkholderia caribensis]|nr:hypothetical protein PCAR4_410092 [Paraburkholderia caribensis]